MGLNQRHEKAVFYNGDGDGWGFPGHHDRHDDYSLPLLGEGAGQASEDGGDVQVGPIKISDPGNFSVNYVVNMKQSIDSRLNKLSQHRMRTTVGKRWVL